MGINTGFLGLLQTTFLIRGTNNTFTGRLLTNTQPTQIRDESIEYTGSMGTLYTRANLRIGIELLGTYQGRNILVKVAHFTPRRIELATAALGHQYSVNIFYLNQNISVTP